MDATMNMQACKAMKREKRKAKILTGRIEKIQKEIYRKDLSEESFVGFIAYSTMNECRGERMRVHRTIRTLRNRLK